MIGPPPLAAAIGPVTIVPLAAIGVILALVVVLSVIRLRRRER